MEKKLKMLAETVLKKKTKEIIQKIDRLMDKDGVGEVLKKKKEKDKESKPGVTQFKKLLDAAAEASCVEELVLFLFFQRSKKAGWEEMCSNNEDIAKNVVNSFQKVQKSVYEEIEKEAKEQSLEIQEEDKRLLELRIVEKYLGYLYWKASAVKKDQNVSETGRESNV